MKSPSRSEWLKTFSRVVLGCSCLIVVACSFAFAQPVVTGSWASLADAKRMILRRNVLWIAGGGVTRYDIAKRSSKHYTVQEGLASNAVFDLDFDSSSHTLWVATSSGLTALGVPSGHEEFFFRQRSVSGPFVISLCNSAAGRQPRVWIGTREEGLCVLEDGPGKIVPVFSKSFLPDSWVSSLANDNRRAMFWVGTPAGIVRVALDSDTPRIDRRLDSNSLSARRLVVDNQTGDLFCATYLNELFQYRSVMNSWERIPLPEEGNVGRILDLALNESGKSLYIGTSTGIFNCELTRKRWQKHAGYEGEVTSLALNVDSGLLYFATRDGIYRSEFGSNQAQRVLQNSPPYNNTVNAIFIEKGKNEIWVGTDGGLARFDKSKQQWQAFDLLHYPGERVLALAVADGSVWCGTMSHGLARVDIETGHVEEIRGVPGSSTVTSLLIDPEIRKIWFGILGPRGGVYEYDFAGKRVRPLPFLDHVSVTSLLMDGDSVWVGTNAGVARFHKRKELRTNPFENNLNVSDVLNLALDHERNQLWVTTESVVAIYDVARKHARTMDRTEGFPSRAVTSILCDGARIWLGTEGDGLQVYDPVMANRPDRSRIKGLGDRYIISMAFDQEEGTLWVGTVNGGISALKVNWP